MFMLLVQFLNKMDKVKLYRNTVVLVSYCFYFLSNPVLSNELESAVLKNCSFLIKNLSKGNISLALEAWDLFDIKKCEYKAKSNGLKSYCPTLLNCKTPDSAFENSSKSKKKYDSSPLLIQKSKQRKKRYSDSYPWFYQDRGRHFFNAGNHFTQFDQNSDEDDSKIENNISSSSDYTGFTGSFAESLFTQQNNFLSKFKTSQKDFTKGLKTSLNQQNKWLQSSIQNTTKNIFDKQKNSTNQIANLWNWAPKQHYNLTEQTSDSAIEICITPGNVEGTCKQAGQCLSFVKVLREVNTSDSTQTGYLRKFQCGRQNNSIPSVCCPENSIVLPGTVTRTDRSKDRAQESITKKLGDVFDSYANICGRQIIGDKIIGGTTTDLAEFPWTALLQYSTSKGLSYGCGGTVISNRYVLTAAHCVNANILRQAGLENLQRVILGEYDTRNETDCIYTPYGTDCAESPQNFGVEQIIQHEQFRPNSTPHDIALIRLDKNISFSNYIRPICLATARSLNLNGNEVFTITGWGRTETGQLSPVKRKTRLPFVSKENCSQLGPLLDGQMCLGSGKGTDSCKGDSGGPVMHTVARSDDIVTILVGIISFGFGRCGTTTSVSTNVTQYMEWIIKNMS